MLLWMNRSKLKLNTDKTEAMPVGTSSSTGLVNSRSANIGGSDIAFQPSVKYLGVKIDDQTHSMQAQICSSICRASFLELRRIASIRPYLSKDAAAKLITSLITSRLDYCNSVLSGLPEEHISRLRRVQNSAVRLVLNKRKRDHVTPLLMELHWWPVIFRRQYKITALANRHFDRKFPPYLVSILCTYQT